ncbi:hypothetical protein ACET3Z_026371 [Daucus carota]
MAGLYKGQAYGLRDKAFRQSKTSFNRFVQRQKTDEAAKLLQVDIQRIKTQKSSSKDGTTVRCTQGDREALLVFKQGTSQLFPLYWPNEEEDCCKWEGVSCDNHTGHVTHLDFRSYPLVLLFLSEYSVLNLPSLTYLDLSGSSLSGHTVVQFIGSLTNLVYLNLSNSEIYGPFPNQIRNHSNLQYLDLSNCDFSDPTPVPKFIGSLNNLTYLDLSYSGFTGVIPHELGNLAKLQYLDLRHNALVGTIPKFISSLSNLTYLDLSHNRFVGVVPNGIGNLSKLQYLHLSTNQLSGVLPESICKLSNLKALDFSFNNFTGNFTDLVSGPFLLLKKLVISHNRFSGLLPDIALLPSLREMQANSNQLNGYLPTAFQHHSSLQVLNLSNNHLRGPLPDSQDFHL